MRVRKQWVCFVLVGFLAVYGGPFRSADAGVKVVVISGETYPGVTGTLTSAGTDGPSLNNAGQIGTRAQTSSSGGNLGMYRATVGSMTELMFPGNPAGNGSGTFQNFVDGIMPIDDTGFVCQRGFYQGSASTSGLIGGNGVAPLIEVRFPAASPDQNGTITGGIPLPFGGGMLFVATLTGTSLGAADNSAIVSVRTNGTLQIVAREGQTVPGGNGKYGDLSFLGLVRNRSQQSVIAPSLTNTSGGTADNSAIIRFGEGPAVEMIRKGAAAPDGNGTFSSFNKTTLTDNGVVAFAGRFTGTSGAPDDSGGVFRTDGTNVATIARGGAPVPDGPGMVWTQYGELSANNAGQVAFHTSAIETAPFIVLQEIILRGDGTTLTTIARQGDTVPDGGGEFNQLQDGPVLNERGDVVFRATLSNAGGTDEAIYFHDDQVGLQKVARRGDALAGSTITDLFTQFGDTLGNADKTYLGFNDHGQVAFGFQLDDSRRGIGLWSPPPALGTLGIQLSPTNLIVVFEGEPSSPVAVQGADAAGLAAGAWSNLTGSLATGTNGVLQYPHLPSSDDQFFRMIALP